MPGSGPAIIVHGGAGPVRDDSLPARLDGCHAAALAGWKLLERGDAALDAVEAAVVALEDNPLFNAGTGSTLNAAGAVETDAAIMAGDSLRAGAVAALSGVKNPVRLARRVLEDGRHVMLAGAGALAFARQIGFPEAPPEAKSTVDLLRQGATPSEAARLAVDLLAAKTGSTAGLIIVDQTGRIGYARNTTHMPVCSVSGSGIAATDS